MKIQKTIKTRYAIKNAEEETGGKLDQQEVEKLIFKASMVIWGLKCLILGLKWLIMDLRGQICVMKGLV